MRTKFIAFRTASETAAEAERAEQYLKAAQFWRKAYQLAQVHRMKIGALHVQIVVLKPPLIQAQSR